MTNKELEQAVMALRLEVASLKAERAEKNAFQDTFSGIQIINHEVQFMQRVRRRTGTVVTTINNF